MFYGMSFPTTLPGPRRPRRPRHQEASPRAAPHASAPRRASAPGRQYPQMDGFLMVFAGKSQKNMGDKSDKCGYNKVSHDCEW